MTSLFETQFMAIAWATDKRDCGTYAKITDIFEVQTMDMDTGHYDKTGQDSHVKKWILTFYLIWPNLDIIA